MTRQLNRLCFDMFFVYWALFYDSLPRSHFSRLPGAQDCHAQTATRPPPPSGGETTKGNPYATRADSTTNFMGYVTQMMVILTSCKEEQTCLYAVTYSSQLPSLSTWLWRNVVWYHKLSNLPFESMLLCTVQVILSFGQ